MKGIAAALLVVVVISTCPPSSSLEVVPMLSDHRWECVSTALDHVVGVPLAWGVTSALRNAPGLASSLQMVGGSGGGVLVATWAARAVADGYFVPLGECAPVAGNISTAGAEEIAACGRGVVYFWLLLVDRFELAMVVDEVCAAAVNVAFVPAMRSLGGGARLLAVHAFKLAAVLSAPEAMVAYFVSGQIQYPAGR